MQPTSMSKAPQIYIKDPTLLVKQDFDILLMSKYDIFYRRIVEFVLEAFEGDQVDDLLATIIDGDGTEFEMRLPEAGFVQSLEKASIYFLKIEEYETCSLIKSLIKNYE